METHDFGRQHFTFLPYFLQYLIKVIKLILKSVRLAWNTVKGIKKKKKKDPVHKEVNCEQDQEPG